MPTSAIPPSEIKPNNLFKFAPDPDNTASGSSNISLPQYLHHYGSTTWIRACSRLAALGS